jgi:CubicO group peptidase (beta-lactamase class C family)
MFRFACPLVLFLCCGSSAVVAAPPTPPGPALAAVDAVLEGHLEQGRIAGAVALVWQEGRLVHERAYGLRSLDRADAMQVGDRFRIASMAKLIVAVGVLILVDRGLLSLDDPVARYLLEFASPRIYVAPDATRPAARPITVRQLLSHTSGLGGAFEGGPVEAMYAGSVEALRTDQMGAIREWSIGGVREPGSRLLTTTIRGAIH